METTPKRSQRGLEKWGVHEKGSAVFPSFPFAPEGSTCCYCVGVGARLRAHEGLKACGEGNDAGVTAVQAGP